MSLSCNDLQDRMRWWGCRVMQSFRCRGARGTAGRRSIPCGAAHLMLPVGPAGARSSPTWSRTTQTCPASLGRDLRDRPPPHHVRPAGLIVPVLVKPLTGGCGSVDLRWDATHLRHARLRRTSDHWMPDRHTSRSWAHSRVFDARGRRLYVTPLPVGGADRRLRTKLKSSGVFIHARGRSTATKWLSKFCA